MKIEIKSRWSGSVLFSVEADSLWLALEAAVGTRADLRGAHLRGADLGGADLRDADLGGAHLRGAHLRGADLRDADLGGAHLRGADLRGADLRDAHLGGADLGGAKDLRLPTGELLSEYVRVVVPALLQAGGKTLAQVAAAWGCHIWGEPDEPVCCPIAEAFSCHDLSGVPLLLRPRAEQFIQLYDGGLIPRPEIEPVKPVTVGA